MVSFHIVESRLHADQLWQVFFVFVPVSYGEWTLMLFLSPMTSECLSGSGHLWRVNVCLVQVTYDEWTLVLFRYPMTSERWFCSGILWRVNVGFVQVTYDEWTLVRFRSLMMNGIITAYRGMVEKSRFTSIPCYHSKQSFLVRSLHRVVYIAQ